ncbi:conserved Plasmodium protein, unknown function [Plasmodium gallinaceum]|uniref:Uncharacterized protein n=1 Tax=Plasmodium gallinaceum TaxID=5849 RepID=A0A1J1GNB1_PLAGA|nr:conserved Plasmodium protein, unknown function [Plasmodium gallinaceum]CRG93836.1 conserved Plasmodium protein, unknown function [Plasmodium gallinaceum]
MNSKTLEILNLLDEKSFKQSEKLINVGLKSKKNEKIYLLLRCLLHSYVNEIEECKQILDEVDIDILDENVFFILVNIYTNLNNGDKLINLYEKKLKTLEENNKNNTKFVNKTKLDIEKILKNLFEFCLNISFFKKGSNISLKLYKNTNESKYIFYNTYLLYLNNSNNNIQVYNLCLNFLKNYKYLNNGKITESFSFFLIFFFLNIKLRNYNECIEINEYAKANNFFLHPLQYNIYKLYIYFIFNKLKEYINILIHLIKEIPENTDYYILYMDTIIYLLNKNSLNDLVDVFKYYKNDLMYLEFFQKCLINYFTTKNKAFPKNIYDFWNCFLEPNNSQDFFKEMIKYVILLYEENKGKNSFEDIISKIELDIEYYKNDIMNIYTKCDVRVYLYMFFLFLLKESKNYNLFYSIKNHLSFFRDDMIIILVVFIKMVLKMLYPSIKNELKNLKHLNKNEKEIRKNIKKKIFQYYKQIYNFEKLLYLLNKKDIVDSFNRFFNVFVQITNNMNVRDDNVVILLVEMALYLDKNNICKNVDRCNINDIHYIHNFYNTDNSNTDDFKIFYDHISKIDDYDNEIDENVSKYHFENFPNSFANIYEEECPLMKKINIKLINRGYYIIALSILKYAYNYRLKMTEKENKKKKKKPILNNEYINVIVLMIYLNNIIGNFSNFSTLIDKLNIKNIQLITYSPILFIHIYYYSYYNLVDNLLKVILNYYNVQQNNLKNSISKCFQNNSFFKINEIVNSYFLNSSNIIFYFIKLLYILKKQVEASKGDFYFNLFSSLKNNYIINNEYSTKFPLKNLSSKNNSLKNKNNKINHMEKVDDSTKYINSVDNTKIDENIGKDAYNNTIIKNEANIIENNKLHLSYNNDTNNNKSKNTNKNNFIKLLQTLNEDIIHDEYPLNEFYSKLMLDKYHFLTIDNQTILTKLNIPSFHFSYYKSFDTFFYNNILYESLSNITDYEFLKETKVINPIEANNINMLKDIKTIYPLIILSNFYNLKGSIHIMNHENLLNSRNFNDILHCKTVGDYLNNEKNNTSNEKIKILTNYSINEHEVNFFTSYNTYVSFDKDNYFYKNKFIFNNHINNLKFNEFSTTSPFNICLTDLFNYPLQTVYLNSIILNTVIYIFHKSFNFYSFDDLKKKKVINKIKCSFLYLIYIINYYELLDHEHDVFSDVEYLCSKKNEENVFNKIDNTENKNEMYLCNENESEEKDICNKELIFKNGSNNYEIMQAAYHNDLYSKGATLYYKCLILILNMYIKIMSNSDINDTISKIKFVYDRIRIHLYKDINVFKQILINDETYQIINLSCVFKQYNYLIHNITIFSLIIQYIYQGKKKISSENNILIKDLINKIYSLLSELNKDLYSLLEILNDYNPLKSSILETFVFELINEISSFYKQLILNFYNIINNKINIIKTYL